MLITRQGHCKPYEVARSELGRPIPGVRRSGARPRRLLEHSLTICQFATLYRTLLENASVVNVDERLQNSFGNSLLLLAHFIARFDQEFTPVRLRIKFCQLVELAAKRADPSGILRRETFERHEILEMVADWVKEPSSVNMSVH
jgi:hypothetical protein